MELCVERAKQLKYEPEQFYAQAQQEQQKMSNYMKHFQ